MHILITGAAGMIGTKLCARLGADGALNGQAIARLTLFDLAEAPRPAFATVPPIIAVETGDLAAPGVASRLIGAQPDVIFHLAGVVSGEAEDRLRQGLPGQS